MINVKKCLAVEHAALNIISSENVPRWSFTLFLLTKSSSSAVGEWKECTPEGSYVNKQGRTEERTLIGMKVKLLIESRDYDRCILSDSKENK